MGGPSKGQVLTLSGNVQIKPVEEEFRGGAIVFVDDFSAIRDNLKLSTSFDNVHGLVIAFQGQLGSYGLPSHNNTLILNGSDNYFLRLNEFGSIASLPQDKNDQIIFGFSEDFDKTKIAGKKIFAFDTITKEGTGTWILEGTLDEGIITADKEDGKTPGILVKEGTLALAPNAVLNVASYAEEGVVSVPGIQLSGGVMELGDNSQTNSDLWVDKGATLYALSGQESVKSLVLNGIYKMDIAAVDNYSQIHSNDTVVIDPDAKLDINATLAKGGDEVFKNIITSDVAVKGIFKQENVTDNSILFDFTPWADPNGKAIHLNAKAVPAPEPEPEPTPTPEPKPEPTPTPEPTRGLIEHLVKEACDDCLAPMAASLDKIKASVDNDIALGLMPLTSEKEVVNAVEQMQPLLGIRTSRVIMEATDTLTKSIPTGRCLANSGENQVWAKVLGEWNEREGLSGLSGYQATHSGIAIGSERCVTENTKLGLTAGYLKTDADSYDSAANHNLKADTWQVGVYGNTELTPQWDIDFYAGIGQAYLDGKRHLSFLGRTAESE
ncbi:hypothetical protein QS62_11650, partial [Gallibacterium salpingitidis]